jgi:hypothetical protein
MTVDEKAAGYSVTDLATNDVNGLGAKPGATAVRPVTDTTVDEKAAGYSVTDLATNDANGLGAKPSCPGG